MKNKDWSLEAVFFVVFGFWILAQLLWGLKCGSEQALCPGQVSEDEAEGEETETLWRSARAEGDPLKGMEIRALVEPAARPQQERPL